MAQLGKADRFYANPILRDAEWNRAKQPPWLLMIATTAIVGVAFSYGFLGYTIGWIIGVVAIVIYAALGWQRRIFARHRLRRLHGQSAVLQQRLAP